MIQRQHEGRLDVLQRSAVRFRDKHFTVVYQSAVYRQFEQLQQPVRTLDFRRGKNRQQPFGPFAGCQPVRCRPVLHANSRFHREKPFQQFDTRCVDILKTIAERSPERTVRCPQRDADIFEKPDLIFARIVADLQQVIRNARPGEAPLAAHSHILLLFVNAEAEHADYAGLWWVWRTTRAGFPTATESAGTGYATTDPAPIVVLSPTSASTIEPAPIQQSAPIRIVLNMPCSAPMMRPSASRGCCWPPLRICTPDA